MKNKTKTLHIRLSPEEADILKTKSDEAKLSQSAYLRMLFSAHRIKRPLSVDVTEALVQLGRIGNNINQIARELHSYNLLDEEGLAENLVDLRKEIASLRKEIMSDDTKDNL